MINLPGEDTDLKMKNTLNCQGAILDLSTPVVMGILNLTSDSFFDGGKYISDDKYISHTQSMLEQGARIIDVGAQSTRPGADLIGADEEWNSLKNPLLKLIKEFPSAVFSIDTFHSSVAERAFNSGVSIVNDISGGSMDTKMFSTVARLKVPYILMHIQGSPATMQIDPTYDDVLSDIINYLTLGISELHEHGHDEIIIDPGFGFGKTVDHNYEILKNLEVLQILGFPIMVGLSRKSLITRILGNKVANALNGTSILNTIALLKGSKIIRVHDVKEAAEAIKLIEKLKSV